MAGTAEVTMYSLRRKGRVVRLFDTPGFNDSRKDDVEILAEIAFWLANAYAANPKLLLSGIVYLHPINVPKMGKAAMNNLTMFKLLCGEESLGSVVLATTMWDSKGSEQDKKRRERQLKETESFWGSMIEHGSTVFRHHNTQASAFEIIDYIIERRQTVVLDIQKQMVDEHKVIENTSAGQELLRNVLEERKTMEERLRYSEQERHKDIQTKKQEKMEELEREKEAYEPKMKVKDENIRVLKLDAENLRNEKKIQWERQRERELEETQKLRDEKAQMQRRITELRAGQDNHFAKVSHDMEIRIMEEKLANLEKVFEQKERHTMKKMTLWDIFGGVSVILAGVGACCVM